MTASKQYSRILIAIIQLISPIFKIRLLHSSINIDGSKATHAEDIPAELLKVTLDIHLSLITKIINLSFENGCFPDDFKLAKVDLLSRKTMIYIKKTVCLLVFYLMCLRSLKESFTVKLIWSCKKNIQTC